MMKKSQRPVMTECFPSGTKVKEELIKNSRYPTTTTKDVQLDHYSSSSSDSKQTTHELPKLFGYNYSHTVGNASTRSTSRDLCVKSKKRKKSWKTMSRRLLMRVRKRQSI